MDPSPCSGGNTGLSGMKNMNLDPGTRDRHEKRAVIIGAGPAGLTAGYELAKAGVKSTMM